MLATQSSTLNALREVKVSPSSEMRTSADVGRAMPHAPAYAFDAGKLFHLAEVESDLCCAVIAGAIINSAICPCAVGKTVFAGAVVIGIAVAAGSGGAFNGVLSARKNILFVFNRLGIFLGRLFFGGLFGGFLRGFFNGSACEGVACGIEIDGIIRKSEPAFAETAGKSTLRWRTLRRQRGCRRWKSQEEAHRRQG